MTVWGMDMVIIINNKDHIYHLFFFLLMGKTFFFHLNVLNDQFFLNKLSKTRQAKQRLDEETTAPAHEWFMRHLQYIKQEETTQAGVSGPTMGEGRKCEETEIVNVKFGQDPVRESHRLWSTAGGSAHESWLTSGQKALDYLIRIHWCIFLYGSSALSTSTLIGWEIHIWLSSLVAKCTWPNAPTQ